MKKVTIYTDGSCPKNPGHGGWAAVILQDKCEPHEISGGARNTTNNRMEMQAVIEGLKTIIGSKSVSVYSDSQYTINGFKKGWVKSWKKRGWMNARKQPVKNKDLWIELDQLNQSMKITWKWVRGHNGNKWNERCDFLAGQEAEKVSKQQDAGYSDEMETAPPHEPGLWKLSCGENEYDLEDIVIKEVDGVLVAACPDIGNCSLADYHDGLTFPQWFR